MADAAAPQGGTTATVSSLDMDSVLSRAEAAFEDMDEGEELENPEADDPAETEYDLGEGEGEPEEDPEPEQDEEQPDEEPEEQEEKPKAKTEPKLGTKDKPLTVRQLPDQYVKMKLSDGTEEVLSLKDAVNSGLRERDYNKRVQEVKGVPEQAERIVKAAKAKEAEVEQTLERARKSLEQLFRDPGQLLELLLDEHEDTLEAVTRAYARQVVQWNQNPRAREQWLQEKHRRKMAEVHERERRTRETAESERRAQESQRRFLAEFEPGYAEGMKLAGYPKFEGEKAEEFRVTVMGLLDARKRATGKPFTRADVKDAVVKAARIVKGGATVEQRRPAARPAPAAPPPTSRERTRQRRATQAPTSFNDLFKSLEDKYR